eukprot:TRINITY_DN9414_c0_g1_i2.p2 TRINITY_DN9414_c0_g1~~TRINITY_DN9414_c0_g1_i2.p2  ORF type:complete len:362 (-),score=112.17 TRINITY_DN9414_c0_g1_i2:68-1153(-)
MANNRFAELSPDFEEEEKERQKKTREQQAKKEALLKKEEAAAEKPRKQEEMGEGREEGGRGRGGRGRWREGGREGGRGGERWRGRGTGRRGERGRWRGERGSGRYHQGPRNFEQREDELEYNPEHKPSGTGAREYKFTGNPNARHPFDRHSGTGRGTEIPKRGHGPRNWGNPEDDYKNEQRFGEEPTEESPKQEVREEPREETGKEGEQRDEGKKWRKKDRKRRGKEEKKEEEEPTGPVYTLSEYKAMQAESAQGLATKKPEVQLAKDPKAATNLKEHQKEQFRNTSTAVQKKKKKDKEQAEDEKKVELGIGLREPPRPAFRSEGYERREQGDRRGRYEPRHEPKDEKPQFVMKEEEFPAL